MDVTEATFETEVLARSREVPVVVDFWAEWCGPCKALAPALEAEVAGREGRVVLVKVDVDGNRELAERYDVRGIPAVKAFRNGRVVREFVGAQSRTSVAAFLDSVTGPSEIERIIVELRATGEEPEVVEALEAEDFERALETLIGEVEEAGKERRDRIRQLMVAVFGELGQDDPLVARYRRRLASALY